MFRAAAAGHAASASSRWSLPASTFSAASLSPSACWACTRRRSSKRRAPRGGEDSGGLYMNANLAAVLYLVAGVLFILSLRGLSSPASSRRGNFLGMAGMAIAVGTTLANHPPTDTLAWILVVIGIAIGGAIGAVIARRGPVTSMPGLVAAFHSLVRMAAVLVAAGAL